MYVIATAGHVDHGKSTLIRALTGMEPDRWAEEKRRGMTIDLGYAWTTLGSGRRVAFVDVPGHQRFITNMLAGIGPVPAVLFVVAADAGWAAQSSEHLDALQALGVRHGVLAITRADLGDAELAEEEARSYLDGTGLEDMAAVAVSPVTGVGVDELRAALERLTASLPPPAAGPARLWVDRAFSIRGAGTVVTGTLAVGSLRLDEPLQVRPSGLEVRIRRIESLKSSVDHVDAVARVALNLRGVKPADVHRGTALTTPGRWADVSVVDVKLTVAARLPEQLIVHLGSAAVAARTRALGEDTVRLTLAAPLPLHIGDRGVLRDPGAGRVLAGAIVLDPMPPPLRRRGAARARAEQLAALDGVPRLADELARRGAARRGDLLAAGVDLPAAGALTGAGVAASAGAATLPEGVLAAGNWLIDGAQWKAWQDELGAVVERWADAHPLQPGMPRHAAASAVSLPDEAVLDALVAERVDLVSDASGVHPRDVVPTLPPEVEAQVDRLVERLRASAFDAAEASELAGAGLTEAYLALAARQGRLVRVGAGIYLRPDALDDAASRLAELDQPFTTSAARLALGTTRRVAIPLLEYLDRTRRTRRVDSDRRTLLHR